MPPLTFACKTDTGRVRKMNQDAFAALTQDSLGGLADGLFVVADGMGGRAGGEVAAQITARVVPEVVNEVLSEGGGMAEAVRDALIGANEDVYRESRAKPELRGMGTTCVTVLVREDTAVVGNVGDSRVYLLRGDDLQALTHDHSLVQEYVRQGEMSSEEARGSRFRNVITRGIGLTSTVAPDVATVHLQEGDSLLLCTDGLTGMLEDVEIARLMAGTASAQGACEALVEAANSRGGRDNTTVVLVRYGEFVPLDLPGVELDGEDADLRPIPHSRRSHRRGSKTNTLLAVVALLLFVALVYVSVDRYTVSPSWPFLRERPADVRPVQEPKAPEIDRTKLTWASPTLVSQKPLRGSPISCDPAGNVFAVTPGGRVVRISPDGKVSPGFEPTAMAADSESGSHIAADAYGFVYVSSRRGRSIARYDAKGTRTGVVDKGLKGPEALAVDAGCNIYVVDGGRLKVLKAVSPPAASPERGDAPR